MAAALLNLSFDSHFYFKQRKRLYLQVVDPKAPGLKLLDILPRLFRRLMGLRRAESIFFKLAQDRRDVDFFQKVVDAFELWVQYPPGSLERIPWSGPLVVVANHPRNGIDGLAIAHMVSRVRGDVKIMLTSTFDGIPGIGEHGIFVSDGTGPSARSRSEPVREAIDWLKLGHVVVVFPAGQGSYVKVRGRKEPVDVPWLKGTSLLIRKGQTEVLPVYVHGSPSLTFLALRHIFHPAAAAVLVREIVNQKGSKVRLIVGEAIGNERVLAAGEPEEQMEFLRKATYDLGRGESGSFAGVGRLDRGER